MTEPRADPLAGLAPHDRELIEADARLLHDQIVEGGGRPLTTWEDLPARQRNLLLNLARDPLYVERGRHG